MKAVHDDDLSVIHKYTQALAKKLAKTYAQKIIDDMVDSLNNDQKVRELSYTGAMTFINTVNTHIFLNIFQFLCYVGNKFPDVDHSSREIFEETLQGLRILTSFKEEDKKEYPIGDIKKVTIKD